MRVGLYIYISFFSLTDEGTNVFETVYKYNKVLVACVDNVYEGVKTRFAVIFGMYDTVIFTLKFSCNISTASTFIQNISVW